MSSLIVPVVLCGGSGTRLWPLSSPDKPKQLLKLVSEHTMLQDTLLRLRHLKLEVAPPIIVCNERHGELVAAQSRELGGATGTIVLEPAGRNSAPAVAIAALIARRRAPAGAEPLLLVLPADHVILDPEAFAAAVEAAAVPAASGSLTTFGVVPTAPATGYGYIRRGEDVSSWSRVEQFVEKPDAATAQAYLDSGRYLWNSGMFLFGAEAWLQELGEFAPAMREACERALAEATVESDFVKLGAGFANCPADSIDYAVMEKTQRAAVVPLSAGWSDVGSWSSLHDVLPKDSAGNAVVGNAIVESCANTYVVARDRVVAVIGVEDVVVVETGDAVLVVAREHAEAVKRVAERASRPKTDASSK